MIRARSFPLIAKFTYTAKQGLAGLGTDVIEACFRDGLDAKACARAEKTWQDTTPPVVTISIPEDMLWPPNHKYQTVVTVTAHDCVDPDPTVTLKSVTSNEADNGLGDGDKPDDIVIIDKFHIKLRAERSGTGVGRVYTITYEVVDGSGNATQVSATIRVPKNK